MDIPYLLAHPEELNQETLYDLRKVVAVYPTYHAARILFLQNLFLMHDPTFDQELRRAALLVPDRRVLFNLTQVNITTSEEKPHKEEPLADATTRMLTNFLDNVPPPQTSKRIKADPSTDYMAFLMQQEEDDEPIVAAEKEDRQDSLMLNFIASQSAGITLSENPMVPEGILDDPDEINEEEEETPLDDSVQSSGELSETLAHIYIKQQKYERAIEVLSKIHNTPSARNNPYYADQVRFLQKLALNDKYKARKQNQQ